MQAGDALAHRPVDNARVPPDDLAVEHKVPRPGQRGPPGHPAHIVLVRDEADLHAVLLMGGGQTEFLRQGPHLLLLIASQRQGQTAHLLPCQAAEHVALIVGGLPLVQCAALRPGIMAGRHQLRPDPVGLLEEGRELQGRVAEDAGIRRLTPEIAVRKGLADLLLQRAVYIQNAQLHAHLLGGGDGLAPGLAARVVQVQAVDLKARLFEQHGGHGGVHPAGKTQYHLAHLLLSI